MKTPKHDVLRVKVPRVTKVTVESKPCKVRSKYAKLKIHNKLIIIRSKFYKPRPMHSVCFTVVSIISEQASYTSFFQM